MNAGSELGPSDVTGESVRTSGFFDVWSVSTENLLPSSLPTVMGKILGSVSTFIRASVCSYA